jgi:hypothetical protein
MCTSSAFTNLEKVPYKFHIIPSLLEERTAD